MWRGILVWVVAALLVVAALPLMRNGGPHPTPGEHPVHPSPNAASSGPGTPQPQCSLVRPRYTPAPMRPR